MSDPLSSQQKADAFYGYAYKSLQTAEQRAGAPVELRNRSYGAL
jgi:hypothetical protein